MRSPNNARRPHRWLSSLPASVAVLVMLAAACGSGGDEPEARPDMVVELPGAERPTDFDDLTYAPVDRWRTGCDSTHGIPAVDDERDLLLAGCGDDGEGVLVDIDDNGKRVDTHAVGGGEALMAHGTDGHFYLRGDPSSTIATLMATDSDALEVIDEASAPEDGHCLLADTLGHYWTCDKDAATILRYTTP